MFVTDNLKVIIWSHQPKLVTCFNVCHTILLWHITWLCQSGQPGQFLLFLSHNTERTNNRKVMIWPHQKKVCPLPLWFSHNTVMTAQIAWQWWQGVHWASEIGDSLFATLTSPRLTFYMVWLFLTQMWASFKIFFRNVTPFSCYWNS